MEIIEYLDKHGILWQPLKLKITGNNKKTPVPFKEFEPKCNDHENESIIKEFEKRKQTTENYNFIAIYTNLVQHFDVDVIGYNTTKYNDGPYFESIVKKTPHYFMKISGGTTYQIPVEGGDLLMSGWSFARKNDKVYNFEKPIPSFIVSDFPKRRLDELKKIVNDLSTKRFEYNSWIKYCMAILNSATEYCVKDPYELIKQFSAPNSDDIEKDNKIIETLKYKSDGVKLPTLIEAHKLNFPEKYTEKQTEKPNRKKELNPLEQEDLVNYEEWKTKWEKNVFVLLGQKSTYIVNDHLFLNDKLNGYLIEEKFDCLIPFRQLNDFTKLSLAKTSDGPKSILCVCKWKNDENKRSYVAKNFLPPFSQHYGDKSIYNTWKKFYMEDYQLTKKIDKERVIDVYKNYKLHMASGNYDISDYLIQLDAHTAQRPGIKPGVCLVYCGKTQGSGKGTELRLLKGLFGDYVKQVSDIKTILGTFTNTLSGALIIQIDEAVPIDMISSGDRLKSLITEDTVKIEQKGRDAFSENSYHRLLIASNSDYPVKIEGGGERRYVFLSPSKLHPTEGTHPKDIHALTHDRDCLKVLFDYLMNIHIKYKTLYDWQENRPITQTYIEARENFVPTYQSFMNTLVFEYLEEEQYKQDIDQSYAIQETMTIKFDYVYEEYKAYCNDASKIGTDRKKFAVELKKMGGVKYSSPMRRIDTNGKKYTYYDINTTAFIDWTKENNLDTEII